MVAYHTEKYKEYVNAKVDDKALDTKKPGDRFEWKCPHCPMELYADRNNTRKRCHHLAAHPECSANDFKVDIPTLTWKKDDTAIEMPYT